MTIQENTLLCDNFTKTFEILGRKWNGMILEVMLNGGAQRFAELSRAINSCSDRVLVERLKELESAGLVVRKTYDDSSLIEYDLTEIGQTMRPMMAAIHDWSDKFQPQLG